MVGNEMVTSSGKRMDNNVDQAGMDINLWRGMFVQGEIFSCCAMQGRHGGLQTVRLENTAGTHLTKELNLVVATEC